MKQHQSAYKILTIILIVICSIISSSIAISQTAEIEKHVADYYKPESWTKSTRLPLLGFKLDNYAIKGFELKEKRYFSPSKGVCYIWYSEEEAYELWTVVNVYASVEAAHNGMFKWLLNGNTSLMEKGTLTSHTEVIGDISWADPSFLTLAFVRDNVVVLIFGRTKEESHRQMVEDIASSIDDGIKTEPRIYASSETIMGIRPVIESITLEESELRVNQKAKLTVIASDPRGQVLTYGYYATGGNILNTKEGIFYQATTPGEHEIAVTVINDANLSSEIAVSVTVLR